ncbi:MAG: hypothetical protein KC561_03695, partial [Myxococcales bacterium]|nr:hypothetical protein [Myxococcales bacterium]
MGEQNVKGQLQGEQLRRFTRSLLNDVKALEELLDSNLIERGIRRIGAEQELFLVDTAWSPAPVAMEVLAELDNADFTTELGRFNLEFNLQPLTFGGTCLRKMEESLANRLAAARRAARRCNSEAVLVGILPTLTKEHLSIDNMTPSPRYYALNEAMGDLRGSDYELQIAGIDEFYLKHDSVMIEACNTSFQVHFQVDPEEFPKFYNLAQAVAGPVLAAASNAPLLFGKRLWRETRIALFQQSVDTRRPTAHLRDVPGRVNFGHGWVNDSCLEVFREQIGRFKVLLQPDKP